MLQVLPKLNCLYTVFDTTENSENCRNTMYIQLQLQLYIPQYNPALDKKYPPGTYHASNEIKRIMPYRSSH